MHDQLNRSELTRIDREQYWHAFTQMAEYVPFIVEKADGVWLQDIDENRYLDGVSSMWCNVHGHCHPAINAAIAQQLQKVAHVTSLGMSCTTTIELVAALTATMPDGLECVFFSGDGSCAMEVALKMAFQYWRQIESPEMQRTTFLAVGNAYHGDTLGSVSVGGISRFHSMFAPLLFDVVRGPCPDTYRLPHDVPPDQAATYYVEQYQTLLKKFGNRVAAIVIEPIIQGAAGMIFHPPGFLLALSRLAKEYGVLLIADEIAVGMGRTGTMWACEQEGVSPDILCSGKGLSGGYLPMAATVTTRQIWDAFLGDYSQSRSLFHGHTFGGNPLGAAASLASLQLFEQEKTLENVRRQSLVLAERLSNLTSRSYVGDVRCRGLVAAIELVECRETKRGFAWQERLGHVVCEAAFKRGVWLRPLGNVIVIMPPLCISDEEIGTLYCAVENALDEVFAKRALLTT